jgi:hypothetical protein
MASPRETAMAPKGHTDMHMPPALRKVAGQGLMLSLAL